MLKYIWQFVFIITITLSFTLQNDIVHAAKNQAAPKTKDNQSNKENKVKQEQKADGVEVWIYDFPMADVKILISKQVLAIKNRNPLNVKNFAINEPWLGQISTDVHGHAIFSTFSYGIRAAALTLKNYSTKHGINTIEGIITRFTETDPIETEQYILYVSKKLGVSPKQKINMKTKLPQLLRHMARYECGMDLPDSLFTPYDILAEM